VRKEASAAGEQLEQCQNPIRTGNKVEIAVFAALSLYRDVTLFLGQKKLKKPNLKLACQFAKRTKLLTLIWSTYPRTRQNENASQIQTSNLKIDYLCTKLLI
jgi:hypothetical protein